MKVKHFSSQPNLNELDPKFMGSSGVRGAQYKRGLPEHRSVFFYTHDSKPEDLVTTHAKHGYEADLSGHSIYDLDTDPDNLIGAMKQRNQNAWNEDILHGIIKEKGHHGVSWTQGPETKVVQMYNKTPVKPIQKGERGDWKKEGYTFDSSPNSANTDLIINASHPKDAEAGRYVFQRDGDNLKVGEALTLRDHRRKGLATEAYRMAEQHFGMKLQPTQGEQTKPAQALWANPKRPFGLKKGEDRYFANDLEKAKIKEWLAAPAAVASMAFPSPVSHQPVQRPAIQQSAAKAPDFSEKMLNAIAQVESSGGKRTNHETLSADGIHQGTSAFGKYGLTPVLVKETLKMNPDLARKYPDLHSADVQSVNTHMAKHPEAQEDIARAHLGRLRQHFGDNPEHIGYGWLNGITGTKNALKAGKNIGQHWHAKKVSDAFGPSKVSVASDKNPPLPTKKSDLEKMSRPRITFPNFPKTSSRPDQEVQVVENNQQKKMFGHKVANAAIRDTVGKRQMADGSVQEGKISGQARREAEAKTTANSLGRNSLGVSNRSNQGRHEPFSAAIAGEMRSKFEEPSNEAYDQKMLAHKQAKVDHLERRNQIVRDYNQKYREWASKGMDLSQNLRAPGGKEAWEAHHSARPEKPVLPRAPKTPAKPKVDTKDLGPDQMAARGRAVDSTIEHEGLHHVLAQVQRHHGNGARQSLVNNMINHFDPGAVQTVVDYVGKIGYKPKSATFGEEVLAHSRDLLVNPKKREYFSKIIGKEKADQVLKQLKAGHQKAYEYAKTVKPEDVGSTQPKKLQASELSKSHKDFMKILLSNKYNK